jgi:hypothetical protein
MGLKQREFQYHLLQLWFEFADSAFSNDTNINVNMYSHDHDHWIDIKIRPHLITLFLPDLADIIVQYLVATSLPPQRRTVNAILGSDLANIVNDYLLYPIATHNSRCNHKFYRFADTIISSDFLLQQGDLFVESTGAQFANVDDEPRENTILQFFEQKRSHILCNDSVNHWSMPLMHNHIVPEIIVFAYDENNQVVSGVLNNVRLEIDQKILDFNATVYDDQLHIFTFVNPTELTHSAIHNQCINFSRLSEIRLSYNLKLRDNTKNITVHVLTTQINIARTAGGMTGIAFSN